MMNQSDNIAELATALVKAQGQIEKLKTDEKATVNPTNGGRPYSYTYASLANVIDCSRKALTDNGLAIVQSVEGGPDTITVVSRLVHTSGQWLESTLTLKPTQPNVQGAGSAATYGRRYSLMALLGVAPEDDDGQAACASPAPQQKQAQPVPIRKASKQSKALEFANQLLYLQKENGLTNEEVLLYAEIDSIKGLVDENAEDALEQACINLQLFLEREKGAKHA